MILLLACLLACLLLEGNFGKLLYLVAVNLVEADVSMSKVRPF